jgi:hypothetical protein
MVVYQQIIFSSKISFRVSLDGISFVEFFLKIERDEQSLFVTNVDHNIVKLVDA